MAENNYLDGLVKVKGFASLRKLRTRQKMSDQTRLNSLHMTYPPTFHPIERQDVVQNLLHHRQTAMETFNHFRLVAVAVTEDFFALQIL